MEQEPLRAFKARHGEPRAPEEVQRRLLQAVSVTAVGLGLGILLMAHRAWESGKRALVLFHALGAHLSAPFQAAKGATKAARNLKEVIERPATQRNRQAFVEVGL